MSLSNEDHLRLSVLVKNVTAVRIDESAMVVYGLSERGEAKVALNPTCRAEQYLRLVREFLSGVALGSPGGYPLHLKRWTRMGQARDTRLAELLMLGEPEAIAAVVCAPGLTDELARRAWWAAPHADNARRMLERACVAQSAMGKALAAHLVEHLPFEEDSRTMIESVRLVLQPGLIDDATRRHIWDSGARRNAYRVGFLLADPDDLPESRPARTDYALHAARLAALAQDGNRFAALAALLLDRPGQTFLAICDAILRQPADQAVVVALLNVIAAYFQPAALVTADARDIAAIVAAAERLCADGGADPALAALLREAPDLTRDIAAMLTLARVSDEIVTPILAQTTAVGSLMRRKLEPVTTPIFGLLATLQGKQ